MNPNLLFSRARQALSCFVTDGIWAALVRSAREQLHGFHAIAAALLAVALSGFAVTPDGAFVYLTNVRSNDVSVIATA